MSEGTLSRVKYQNYLLVEGSDDKHVFYHLLDYYHIRQIFKNKGESFEIIDHEGIDNLLSVKTLGTYLKGSSLRRFGIVVDADTDLAARWQRISDILKSAGYTTIPVSPQQEGTILREEESPVVGVWLMPDNTVPGMIEHLMSLLRPDNDVLWPIAENIVQTVTNTECRFPSTQMAKAYIHTWLAWQKEPGKPMGQAITAHYLNADASHAQQLISWIRRLFDLETV